MDLYLGYHVWKNVSFFKTLAIHSEDHHRGSPSWIRWIEAVPKCSASPRLRFQRKSGDYVVVEAFHQATLEPEMCHSKPNSFTYTSNMFKWLMQTLQLFWLNPPNLFCCDDGRSGAAMTNFCSWVSRAPTQIWLKNHPKKKTLFGREITLFGRQITPFQKSLKSICF